ncbi:unnamed protein product [Psylliodes chrysocephalus]|uniref:AIMP2 thioredoxin-like domain-containing protein n=2 Tax=Psylliodes chrysocephalus TaxID=3402493 RepID=A0A9P0D9Y5_9CUCU|nr:unnamed protein product [Psylliodes chrysocephala]
MSGSIKMYRTTQIVKHDLPVKLPKCMYTLKNIHSRDTKGMVAESTDHVSTLNKNSSIFDQVKQFLKNNQHISGMADLVAKQEDILKQLGDLKKQIQSIKLDLKISPTNAVKPQNSFSTASTQRLTGDLPDLVVNANPTHPPFSLEILQKLLQDSINFNVTCYLHSSVSKLTDNAQKLEQSLLSHKEKSGIPKINIRLIWKNVSVDTEFIVSHSPIQGEVNLLRYLTRAIPCQLSYDSYFDCIEIDSILDICYLIVRAKTKTERAGHLVTLNKYLGKSQWLGGRKTLGVADVAAYSSLKQAASSNEINSNLTKWYQRCETVA